MLSWLVLINRGFNPISLDLMRVTISKFWKNNFFLGNDNEGGTPVPIPNTEVKPFGADDSACENRTLPRIFFCIFFRDTFYLFFYCFFHALMVCYIQFREDSFMNKKSLNRKIMEFCMDVVESDMFSGLFLSATDDRLGERRLALPHGRHRVRSVCRSKVV